MPGSFPIVSALAAALSVYGIIDTVSAATAIQNFSLVADYHGDTFFDGFTTFTGQDPTAGFVQYVDIQTAKESELVGMVYNATSNSSLAYLGVDHINAAPNGRNSVRLLSKETFGMGSLLVADVAATPSQCGVWPALWLLGGPAVWPSNGEIDIIETVHDDASDHITLHSSPGCQVDNGAGLFYGNLSSTDCNAGNGDLGCSVSTTSRTRFDSKSYATAGKGFSHQGGAIYATSITTDGVVVYMFPRERVPSDIISGHPNPSSWTAQPLANFTGAGCDFNQHFQNLQLIINTDFCGSWAGEQSVWESSGCAAKTNTTTCNAYVASNPAAFKNANWLFNSIKVYSNNATAIAMAGAATKRDATAPGMPSNCTNAKDDCRLPRRPKSTAQNYHDFDRMSTNDPVVPAPAHKRQTDWGFGGTIGTDGGSSGQGSGMTNTDPYGGFQTYGSAASTTKPPSFRSKDGLTLKLDIWCIVSGIAMLFSALL